MSTPTTMQWIRHALQRLGTGSVRLALHLAARTAHGARTTWQRATGWLNEGTGLGWVARLAVLLAAAALARKLLITIAGALYERIHAGAAPGLMFGAAGVWVVAAYRCGRDGWQPKHRPTTVPQDEQAAPQETAAEQAPAGPPPPTLQQLHAALQRVGTPHAHIAVLAADLEVSPERVREALARHDVAVETVRMRGRGASTGIKSDALPAPTAPTDGVVAAGQPANNDNNNAWTTVPDEVNPVRTHVVWRDH